MRTPCHPLPYVHDPGRTPPELLEELNAHGEWRLARILRLLEGGDGTPPRVLLAGPEGIGKSHLLHLATARLAESSLPGAAVVRPGPEVRASFARFRAALLEPLAGPPRLLLIDDLGELLAGWRLEERRAFRALLQEHPGLGLASAARMHPVDGGLAPVFASREEPFFAFFRVEVLPDPGAEALASWYPRAVGVAARGLARPRARALESWLGFGSGRDLVRRLHQRVGPAFRLHQLVARTLPLLPAGLSPAALEAAFAEAVRQAEDLFAPARRLARAELSPQQRLLLELLEDAGGALTVKALAERAGVTHQTASAQLRILRAAGLVRVARRGRFAYYSVLESEAPAVP